MIRSIIIFVSIFFLINCQSQKEIQTNVALIDSAKFQNIISNYNGNVLVVNVWATWCLPCVEEMPDLVKITDLYESESVKIIGISIDFPEEIQSKILPFMNNNKINFPIYVNDFKNDEALINFLNEKWSGAIPTTFIYDKTGIQKEVLLGKHSFDDFKYAIEQVL